MAGGDLRHSPREGAGPSGRRLRRATGLPVLLVLVLAAVSFRFDLGPRWLGWDHPSPLEEPAAVAPPPGLDLPVRPGTAPVAEGTAALSADPRLVRRALAPLVRDERLGRRVAVAVDQLVDGAPVYRSGSGPVTPASTLKILTAVAALEAVGPARTFRTTVVEGATARELVLVGGGDPLLATAPPEGDGYPPRADLRTLAHATARSLDALGRDRVRLRYDAGLFAGPAVSPDWPAGYLADDVVSPISALWADQGRVALDRAERVPDPAATAAQRFARALEQQGVRVAGRPRPATATTEPGEPGVTGEPAEPVEVAAVESAPVEQLVQWMLEVSDNETAEVLLRHVALAEGAPATFTGGTAALTAVLERLGVPTEGARVLDGSGLARGNRLRPETLLGALRVAAAEEHPALRPAVATLPVAGFTGSLAYRFTTGDPAGPGRVRAKTGTLTGVHALAGVVAGRDGSDLAFVAVADRVAVPDTLAARALLDQIAAALAGCACAAGT